MDSHVLLIAVNRQWVCGVPSYHTDVRTHRGVSLTPIRLGHCLFKLPSDAASKSISQFDDLIPFSDSEELVADSSLPQETLIEIGNDHRLADEASLSVMLWACNLLASGENLPWLDDESQSSAGSSSNGKATSQEDACYICDACGEEIIIPLDLTEGSSQTCVEDCPVCCRANTIHVQIDEGGDAQVWAEPEQDYE